MRLFSVLRQFRMTHELKSVGIASHSDIDDIFFHAFVSIYVKVIKTLKKWAKTFLAEFQFNNWTMRNGSCSSIHTKSD